jgi:hypothetical protein
MLSKSDPHNPFTDLDWPDQLPHDQCWMSRELLSVYGTPLMEQLTPEQLLALAKWESINFYSLNVHGIRELLLEVMARIHTPGFEAASEYFHHLLGEENEHMWFFAKFCLKYGGKLYPEKRLKFASVVEPDVETFLVFTRILLFEEIVDYFNAHMGADTTVPFFVRELNQLHHKDESRHIAFGRHLVGLLHAELRDRYDEARLAELESYVRRYLASSLRALYNPAVYRDAGLSDPYGVAAQLPNFPGRSSRHELAVKRTTDFLRRSGIYRSSST